MEREFGITLPDGHEIHVHEDSETATHIVLPPPDKRTEEEREAARSGAASLEFLKKTMYDPAPSKRPAAQRRAGGLGATVGGLGTASGEALAKAARASIRRGLAFLESSIDENGRLALHPVQCCRSGYPAAFRTARLCFGFLRACLGKLRRTVG